MKLIQEDVNILDKKIKILQKKSQNLYIEISKKYPTLSEKDIQKEILYSLK